MLHVVPLHLADVTLPESHPRAGEPCPVFAFLIRHSEGYVLVDTGVGEDHQGIETLYSPQIHPLAAELKARNVSPSDIIAIINTHLHFDHCGGNRQFPSTPIYVQRAEHEAAQAPLYSIPEWIDFKGADYHLLNGETEVAPGITALPTPGHTPGHQSVVIDREDDRAIIAGHAAYNADEWNGAVASVGGEWNDEQYNASLESLQRLRPDRVYFSHDPVVWERTA